MKRFTILLLFTCITTTFHLYAQDIINTLKERIQISGYAQVGYTYNDAEEVNNNFEVRRALLIVNGKITDKWSACFMYNFHGSTMLEAYMEYKLLPGLNARVGQFKLPYTIENPISTTVLELVNSYSQAASYFAAIGSQDALMGSTSGRDMGVMLYGNVLNDKFTYNLGIFNGQGINKKDQNSAKDVVANLMFHPLSCLSVGGSLILGEGHAIAESKVNPDIHIGDNYTRNRYAVGGVLKTKPFDLRTEYLAGKDGKVKSEGYYATASLHLLPKFDVVASYDFLNKNKAIDYKQTNYVAGIQYWFYPRCRVQLQYTYSDKCGMNEKDGNMLQAQFQVRF